MKDAFILTTIVLALIAYASILVFALFAIFILVQSALIEAILAVIAIFVWVFLLMYALTSLEGHY